MDFILSYGIGSSAIISILSGWFIINGIKQQQRYLKCEAELFIQKQSLQATEEELVRELSARRDAEQQLRDNEKTLRELYTRLATAEERLTLLANVRLECEQLNQKLCSQRDLNHSQEMELRAVTIHLKELQLSANEKQRLLINCEERMSIQFENLANRIFEQNGRKMDNQNYQSIDKLLVPLREQLEGFRRQIQDSFNQEACEHHTLAHEIKNLQQLNTQIAQEAVNLTRALKGDNKVQGNWGEVVLSRILEISGLREGHEFQTQVSFKQVEGQRVQPDVLVRLPHGKDVVIDAKISLVAYERYCNSNNEVDRKLALGEHINSLRAHMKVLSKKDYQQLPGLRTLDYILMFVPVESAFIVAIDKHPELINEAFMYNTMLVSPTTLLVALRTINNLWRYERQNHNAKHIAERAARIYDKLRLFVDDMNNLGHCLEKAQTIYQQAKNKLFEGRGNLIRLAEGFRPLGVEIKRPIAPVTPLSSDLLDHPDTHQLQDGDVNKLSNNIQDYTVDVS